LAWFDTICTNECIMGFINNDFIVGLVFYLVKLQTMNKLCLFWKNLSISVKIHEISLNNMLNFIGLVHLEKIKVLPIADALNEDGC
jgi:hypothetical protein